MKNKKNKSKAKQNKTKYHLKLFSKPLKNRRNLKIIGFHY